MSIGPRIIPFFVCLAVLMGLPSLVGRTQPGVKKFSQLSTPDGLSQGTVNSILKDRYGFMWFGTQDGLNKFDGNSFTVYRSNPKNRQSLPENQVKCLVEDSAGNLWIGTMGGGLSYYDRMQDSFYRPQDLGFESDAPLNTAILCMYIDSRGRLWVGTFQDLLLIDRRKKRIFHFEPDPGNPRALGNGIVQSLFEDSRHRLWIGTANGLDMLEDGAAAGGGSNEFRFVHYKHRDGEQNSLSSNQVLSVAEDAHGKIWAGTLGGGLNEFDPVSGKFTIYKSSAGPASLSGNVVRSLAPAGKDQLWVGTEDALDLMNTATGECTHFKKDLPGTGTLSNNTVLSLLLDNTGILWAGTAEGGVNRYDPHLFLFDLYRKTSDPYSLSTDIVTSFAETPSGDIWIGTDGGGLNRWDHASGHFIHYLPQNNTGHSVNSKAILSLLINRKKDRLYIGTFGGGLDVLDLSTGVFHYYRGGASDKELSSDAIYSMLEDRAGRIWMGTNGGGIDILDPATGIIDKHRQANHADSLGNDYIRCLLQDRTGRIWIGTYSSGISVYDPRTGKFALYDKLNNGLGNQVVFSLCEDAQGVIWAGTMGGGLDRFDSVTKKFASFNEDNGLANNIVTGIVADERGRLWLSTKKGISVFNPSEKTFRNYGIHHGIQDPEFSIGAAYRTGNGRILFGGINGFNVFNPGEVMDNKVPPVTRFTGFLLKNAPLRGDLNQMDRISLSYDQADFTISYAAMSYTIPQENRYTYILQGFDKSWTRATLDRRATYTNVPPGDYLFRIKAANNDGLLGTQETTLHIHISPPFWKTWWAWTLYILAAAALLYFIYRDIATREKLRAQIRLERMTADKMKELNRIKLNFFTNASHELRTPLSLIMDPLRKLTREELSHGQIKQYSGLMYNNAQRLMTLIDQMLDLRRLEEGHDQISLQPSNIVLLTRNIAALFDIHARERNISYSVHSPTDELVAFVDQDKFEKIIFNLVSNAFKYTADGGAIAIHINPPAVGTDWISIHVIDTGIGIPAHLTEKVFEIFYQVEDAARYERGSTGIGLALTKELIELHHGRVEVRSELGKGSDFIIWLPAGKAESGVKSDPIMPSGLVAPVTDPVDLKDIDELQQESEGLPIILVIEDNKDLREYVSGELRRQFRVLDAADGSTGLALAIESIPDCIVSDIMMPGLSGLELCEQIKHDERTSHIPVILLTARQSDDHQIEGYGAGADAYVSKPFNLELLVVRINNLLEGRKRLRQRYAAAESGRTSEEVTETQLSTEQTSVSPSLSAIDKAFLEKAARIVDEHLADITFDTDMLAVQLKVSRRQLYRKIKALTDQTVHDFVTGIRLEKARALLLTGELTIAEIGFRVGYSEPANFTRSFTRYFGKSPRKYVADTGRGNAD